MLNIGIDAVEIDRFRNWKNYSQKTLSKIFSQSEIDYCIAIESKSAERFASHFAAKEAFYKAISFLLNTSLPFLKICKLVAIDRVNKIPILNVDWQNFILIGSYKHLDTKISLTHSKVTALAVVIIFKK